MTSEQELIKDCIKGKSRALEALYDKYAPMLLSVCMRYVPERADAEDILQEAFIRILKSISKFEPRHSGAFEGWMKRIVVNLSLNFIRDKMKTRNLISIDHHTDVGVVEDDLPFSPESFGVSTDEIHALIGNLPAGYRTVFNMYVFEDYSHKEIAALLNCSESTSKTQLLKARNLLKKNILMLSSKKGDLSQYGN
jgi:RNA polymerase sigma factor (sigma-70 family)